MPFPVEDRCMTCDHNLPIEEHLFAMVPTPDRASKYELYYLPGWLDEDTFQGTHCGLFCSVNCFSQWLEKVFPVH